MGKHPNPKPQTTRTQDPTQVLVGEGKRGKHRSQDPQVGTSLATFGVTRTAVESTDFLIWELLELQ